MPAALLKGLFWLGAGVLGWLGLREADDAANAGARLAKWGAAAFALYGAWTVWRFYR